MEKLAKKFEKIKQVWLEIREDGKAAIVFERENGKRACLMCPPLDEQSPMDMAALSLIEVEPPHDNTKQ